MMAMPRLLTCSFSARHWRKKSSCTPCQNSISPASSCRANGSRPAVPGIAAVAALQRHKEGVVRQPARLLLAEPAVLLPVPGQQPLHRQPQHRVAAPVQLAIVHPGGVVPPGDILVLLRQQQPLIGQVIQVDEVGVAGVGGKGLVGGIPIAGGPHRQHLPAGLPPQGQQVGKLPGGSAQGADAVGGGKGGNRHQDTGFSHGTCSFSI